MLTVPGMRKSKTLWPSNIMGKSTTECARQSTFILNFWFGMEKNTERNLALHGELDGNCYQVLLKSLHLNEFF